MAEFKTITLEQFATMFQVSKSTASRWIRTENMPRPRKIGKKFFFDYQEVMAWWEQRGVQGENIYQPEAL
jgi:excisionase family DNA binding protein